MSDRPLSSLLLDRAEPSVITRGRSLYQQQCVCFELVAAEHLRATVETEAARFRVCITSGEPSASWSCDCKRVKDVVCAHQIAVALAYDGGFLPTEFKPKTAKNKPGERIRQRELSRLSQAVGQLDLARLRLLVMSAAENHDEARRALMERCVVVTEEPDALIGALEALLRRSSPLRGAECKRYADRVLRAIDLVEQSLAQQLSNDSLSMADEVLKRACSAYASASDGSGELSRAVQRSQVLWCRVLRDSGLPIASRARRFLDALLTQPAHSADFEANQILIEVEREGPIFLDTALERYHRLREKLGSGNWKSTCIRRVAQQLADQLRDVDTWVALENTLSIDRRDLNGIIDHLVHAGRQREAIQWAETTLRRETPKTPDALRMRLAHLYWDDGLEDEALCLLWENFQLGGDLPAWRTFKSLAQKSKRWPYWLDKARAWASNSTQQPNVTPEKLNACTLWFIEEGLIENAQRFHHHKELSSDTRVALALALIPLDRALAGSILSEVTRDWLGAPWVGPDTLKKITHCLQTFEPTTDTSPEAQAQWQALLATIKSLPRYGAQIVRAFEFDLSI